MTKLEKYIIGLYIDEIKKSEDSQIIRHPLDYLYYLRGGKDPVLQGDLTFNRLEMEKSRALENIYAAYLEFRGEPESEYGREAWADPLRVEILKRFSEANRSWYISFHGHITYRLFHNDNRPVNEELYKYISQIDPSKKAVVQSTQPYGYGLGYFNRLFFEVSNQDIEWVVTSFWKEAFQGYPIEGYNLPSGRIDLIKKWDLNKGDESLFREVMDDSSFVFYTYPEENRDFAFLTNKVGKDKLKRLIGIRSLREMAKEIAQKNLEK